MCFGIRTPKFKLRSFVFCRMAAYEFKHSGNKGKREAYEAKIDSRLSVCVQLQLTLLYLLLYPLPSVFIQRPIGIEMYRRSNPWCGKGDHRGIIATILPLRHEQRDFFAICHSLKLLSQMLIIGNAARNAETFKGFHPQCLPNFTNKRIRNRRLVRGANRGFLFFERFGRQFFQKIAQAGF